MHRREIQLKITQISQTIIKLRDSLHEFGQMDVAAGRENQARNQEHKDLSRMFNKEAEKFRNLSQRFTKSVAQRDN